jgi:hypothetical protein
MTKRDQKTLPGFSDRQRFDELPKISKNDSTLKAISLIKLPSHDQVQKGLYKVKNQRVFCMIWAMIISARNHQRVETGEFFAKPTADEGAMYAPAVKLWYPSKKPEKTAGSMTITQDGFGPWLYSEQKSTDASKRRPVDPVVHYITNDGSRGTGYRFIRSGKDCLNALTNVVMRLKNPMLRIFFMEQIEEINKDVGEFVTNAVFPNKHRFIAKVTYGINRKNKGDNLGYLDINFRKKLMQEVAAAMYIDELRDGRYLTIELTEDQMLVIKANPKGWKLTNEGKLQASRLMSTNIYEPTLDTFNQVEVGKNVAFVYDAEKKTLTAYMPEDFCKFQQRLGGGCSSRRGTGSKPGRPKTLNYDRPDRNERDFNDVKPPAPKQGAYDHLFALAA